MCFQAYMSHLTENHFEVTDEHMICKICGRKLKKTNRVKYLKKHLNTHVPKHVNTHVNVKKEVGHFSCIVC